MSSDTETNPNSVSNESELSVNRDNFVKALAHIRPSVSEEVINIESTFPTVYITIIVYSPPKGQAALRKIAEKVHGYRINAPVIVEIVTRSPLLISSPFDRDVVLHRIIG